MKGSALETANQVERPQVYMAAIGP